MTLAGVYARVKLASLKDKTLLHQCSVWHKGDMLIWKSISLSPPPHTHTITGTPEAALGPYGGAGGKSVKYGKIGRA